MEELARTLFDNSRDAFLIVDCGTLRVIEVNASALRLLASQRGEIQRASLEKILVTEPSHLSNIFFDACRKRTPFEEANGFSIQGSKDRIVPLGVKVIPFGRTQILVSLRPAQGDSFRTESGLARLLDSIPVAVCRMHRSLDASSDKPEDQFTHWRYQYTSPTFLELISPPGEPLSDRPQAIAELIHSQDKTRFFEDWATFLQSPSNSFTHDVRWGETAKNPRWIRIEMRAGRNAMGEVNRLDCVLTDVSRPKQMERTLEESQQYLSRVLETSANGIVILDLGGRISYLNPAAEQLFGQKRAKLMHCDWNALPWRSDENDNETTPTYGSPQTLRSSEQELERPDGRILTVALNASPLRDESGAVTGVLVTFTDIGQKKRAEEAMRLSEDRYRRVFESHQAGVCRSTLDGEILDCNETYAKMLGFNTVEDIKQYRSNSFYFTTEELKDTLERLVQENHLANITSRLRSKSGEEIWVSKNMSLLKNHRGEPIIESTLFDITENRRAEQALRQSEERYRRLFEHNLAGVWRTTIQGDLVDCNQSFARTLGFDSPQNMIGLNMSSVYYHPEDQDFVISTIQKSGSLSNHEYRLRKRDGNEVWVLANIISLEMQDSWILEGTLFDITERKRAEAEFSREHALLRALIDSIPDMIHYKDRDGHYLGCNRAFEHYSGIIEEKLIGKKASDLFTNSFAQELEAEDLKVFTTRQPLRIEKNIITPAQGERLIELLLTPMFDEGGGMLGILGVGRDITERHRLEEQLHQAGKMEAIGRLAGGVAHDFNNLLTIILGNVSLAQAVSSQGREFLIDLEKAAQRAAELTEQLLGFARRNPLSLQSLDINQCVEETIALLRRAVDPRIELNHHAGSELWPVEADRSQLGQVLMNLCLNARDAIQESGQILIQTENIILPADEMHSSIAGHGGDFVRLRVKDTGIGIPPDALARIFEPFFTTKPLGQGTGLGLAMVYGIIQQHRGWIECHSSPGQGTTFDIYLPRTHKSIVSSTSRLGTNPTGNETVLIVDDEPMIRNLGQAVLEQAGYRTLTAEDGQDAVEIYRQKQSQIDIIVLDLTMPRMSGYEALHKLREINPNVRVIFASGYSVDQIAGTTPTGVAGFLHKPYRPDELTTAIRNALDSQPH